MPASHQGDPRREVGKKVISSLPVRRRRALAFQSFVLIASAAFVALALAAHASPYFAIDLTITRAVQSYHGHVFDRLMVGMSWLGFSPQATVLGVIVVLALYAAGLRWEAMAQLFASFGVAFGGLVKLIVYRPRPSADLVNVFAQMSSYAFPSGHVLMATTVFGFLAFLAFTLLKPSPARTILIVTCVVLILLMGLSRIYLGAHWFSDVMGAYMLGSLWLAISIKFYRWGKPRFFVRQPVAPVPAAERAA